MSGTIETTIFIKDEFSQPLGDLQDGLEQSCEYSEEFNDDLDRLGGQAKHFGVLGKSVDLLKQKVDGVRESLGRVSGAWGAVKDKSDAYFNSVSGKTKELTENMAALYGEAGVNAMKAYAGFAEANGWEVGEVVQAGARANRYGLGQDTTSSMLKMADRFAMITSASIGDVMDNLMSSVEGQSVGSVAQLMGGGAGVERDLQRMGYERALRVGNVQKAMKILEEVANKYGRTADAAERAAKSTGVQAGILMTKMTNAANRIKGAFLRSIEPTIGKLVASLTKAIESDAFQSVLTGIERVFSFIGAALGGIANAISYVIDLTMNMGGSAAKITASFLLLKSVFVAISGIVAKHAIFSLFKFLLLKIPLVKNLASKAFGFLAGGVKKFAIMAGKLIGLALRKLAMMVLRHPLVLLGTIAMFALTKAADAFSGFNQEITGKAGGMLSNIVGMISYGVGVFIGNVTNMIADFVNLCKSALDSFMEVIRKLVVGVKTLWGDVKKTLFDGLSSAIDTVLDKFEKIARFLNMDASVKSISEARNSLKSVLVAEPVDVRTPDFYKPEYMEKVDPDEMGKIFMQANSGWAGKIEDKLNEFMGFVGVENKKDREAFGKISDDTGKIRGMMTEEQEVAWLKELGERQYINKLNVESPKNTFNIAIKTSKDVNTKDFEKELESMVEAQMHKVGYGVGINQRLQPA